jgi:hypothetical protein
MSDKRTGMKKKKIRPVVTEEMPLLNVQTPVNVPKKTKPSPKK